MERKGYDRDKLHNDNRGYSIIELIIELAIIAIIMGTVLWNFTEMMMESIPGCMSQRAMGR